MCVWKRVITGLQLTRGTLSLVHFITGTCNFYRVGLNRPVGNLSRWDYNSLCDVIVKHLVTVLRVRLLSALYFVLLRIN